MDRISGPMDRPAVLGRGRMHASRSAADWSGALGGRATGATRRRAGESGEILVISVISVISVTGGV